MGATDLVVCLGFPPFHEERYLGALRAVPGVEPVVLPIDPGGVWATVDAGEPQPEPPVWAAGLASERCAALQRAEVLVALHAPADLLRQAPSLRWIQACGAGVEQFALAGASRDRVVVTNASGVSAVSMAEWVVGRLLQVWKRFRDTDAFQREHVFERTYGRTMSGATIGIIGLGHIGCAVSQRVRAFGCRVVASKRSAGPGVVSQHADELYRPEQLHEMLAQCDAVVVSAPATPETRHLIDAAALEAMPSHSILVNVARGSLVDEDALARTMQQEGIAAAVLDVFDQEPLQPESPLWNLPGVYVSAHSSVSVDRYMEDVFEIALDNVKRKQSGEPLRNVVDMQALGFG